MAFCAHAENLSKKGIYVARGAMLAASQMPTCKENNYAGISEINCIFNNVM